MLREDELRRTRRQLRKKIKEKRLKIKESHASVILPRLGDPEGSLISFILNSPLYISGTDALTEETDSLNF
jgi:hypothetical protein